MIKKNISQYRISFVFEKIHSIQNTSDPSGQVARNVALFGLFGVRKKRYNLYMVYNILYTWYIPYTWYIMNPIHGIYPIHGIL